MNKIISYKSHNKEKYNDKVLSETETPDGLNKKITNEKIKNEKKMKSLCKHLIFTKMH
jgi:hypothetical protein